MAAKSELRKNSAKPFVHFKEMIEHPYLQGKEPQKRKQEILLGICDGLLDCASVEDIIVSIGCAITDRITDSDVPADQQTTTTARKLAQMDVLAQRLFRAISEGF